MYKKIFLLFIVVVLGGASLYFTGDMGGRAEKNFDEFQDTTYDFIDMPPKEEAMFNSDVLHTVKQCSNDIENGNIIKAELRAKLIVNNGVSQGRGLVWTYKFDGENYSSAYIQSEIADLYLKLYFVTQKEHYMKMAIEAMNVTKTYQFEDEGMLGLLRQLVAYKHIYNVTGVEKYKKILDEDILLFKEKAKSLDTGYCFLNDMEFSKSPIVFRLLNPYNNDEDFSAINVYLVDCRTGGKIDNLKINSQGEFALDVSKQIAIENQSLSNIGLLFDYDDFNEKKVSLQIKSKIIKDVWDDVRDGDLLFSGKMTHREWLVPLRLNCLCDDANYYFMSKYAELLNDLVDYDESISSIKIRVDTYVNMYKTSDSYEEIIVEKSELPKQTPSLNVYSFDDNGVIMEHTIWEGKTKLDEHSQWVTSSLVGAPRYSVFAICNQAKYGTDYTKHLLMGYKDEDFTFNRENNNNYNFISSDNSNQIRSEPAYNWFENNAKLVDDFVVWPYEFDNCYNDLIQNKGWVSAWGQAMVLDALMKYPERYKDFLLKGAKAYEATVDDGGLAFYDSYGYVWFEEVPNKSHILNADILSINTLYSIYDLTGNDKVKQIADNGYESLRIHIGDYDTGYWSKYDMNPKKDILFQIDWLEGDKSIAVNKVELLDPVSMKKVVLNNNEVDSKQDNTCFSGKDWMAVENLEEHSVRYLINGYKKGNTRTKSSMEQNSFFRLALPTVTVEDYFNLPCYRLRIVYKDTGEGVYKIKIQSINEGWKLDFVDIPDGTIVTTGDNKWKVKELLLKPKDLGWYMGKEYQDYHVKQLEKLAQYKKDIILQQYAERWNYYLEKKVD